MISRSGAGDDSGATKIRVIISFQTYGHILKNLPSHSVSSAVLEKTPWPYIYNNNNNNNHPHNKTLRKHQKKKKKSYIEK